MNVKSRKEKRSRDAQRRRLLTEQLEERRLLVAPQAVADAYGVVAGTTLEVSAPGLLANDRDTDGDPITAQIVSQPTRGSLTLNADGSFRYTPNANFLGTDSFRYRASDGLLFSEPATVTIQTVDGTPITQPDEYTVREDAVLTVTAANGVLRNDTDIANDPLTAVLSNAPVNGTLSLADNGSFVYTPNANFSGTDQFTYRASDGTRLSPTTTVTITVTPVADAPVATDDQYLVFEDETLVVPAAEGVLANDEDADNDLITAQIVTNVSSGALTLNSNGSFSYTPANNFNGAVTFTYRASDGTSQSNLATVTLLVTPVIRAEDDNYTVSEDNTLNVSAAGGILANDELPTTDQIIGPAILSGPSNGTLELSPDGAFRYVPRPNFFGTDTFTYTARVGGVQNLVQDIGTPTGMALDLTNGRIYFTDAATRTIRRANLNGQNVQVLVNTGLNNPGGIAVDPAGGKIYWTDLGSNKVQRANLDGTQVQDLITTGLIDPRDVALDVAGGKMYITDAGGAKILRSNLDGTSVEQLINVGTVTPTEIVLDKTGGKIYWTDSSGSRIQRANLNGTTLEDVVVGVDQPVGIAIDTTEGKVYWTETGTAQIRRADLVANQISGDAETLVDTGLVTPTALDVDAADGKMYWTDIGSNSIQRTSLGVLADPIDSNTATVTINVIGVNDAPIAFDDAYAVSGATSITVPVSQGVAANDLDPDGETVTVLIVQGATRGTVTLSTNGSFVYTPRATFNGVDTFTYRLRDTAGLLSQIATVTLTNRPIIRTENVELTSNPSGQIEGAFDVYVDFAGLGSIAVTGYEVQLGIFEAQSGIQFTGAEAPSTAHQPALLPGQTPTVPVTGDNLSVTDFATSGTVPLTNNRGLFRGRFTVDAGTTGTFHIVFDATFTNISNASARPIVLGGLVGGSITVEQGIAPVPSVVEVLVGNEATGGWSQAYLDELANLDYGVGGYSIPVGTEAQLLPLSWDGISTIKVRFSEDVDVDQADLRVIGVNIQEYTVAGFAYDPATFTGTWQLLGPIDTDKIEIILNSDPENDPVKGIEGGELLDGEWEDGFSVYPSGNGIPGGDFRFRFNVLPGDVDANLRTNIFDTIQTRDRQFTAIGDLDYSVFNDIDGNGVINIFDTVKVSNNQFSTLPIGEPELPEDESPEPPQQTLPGVSQLSLLGLTASAASVREDEDSDNRVPLLAPSAKVAAAATVLASDEDEDDAGIYMDTSDEGDDDVVDLVFAESVAAVLDDI